jgi:hypothetical protein
MIRTIELREPSIEAGTVTFTWHVDPPSALYRRHEFTLQFPPEIDLARVPRGIWWIVAIACLHTQWLLLRPCRVRLPVELEPEEIEVWLRLMDSEIATLEAYRGTRFFERCIVIECAGRPSPDPVPLLEGGRCATSFSGGKDSLLQAALLAEFTDDPVLVATTSPIAAFSDHTATRRRYVFDQSSKRLGVRLVEVHSTLRSAWDNMAAGFMGYPLALTEMADAFFYFSSTLVVAAALGITHCFLASETEVQTNAQIDGRFVQITHFMYSAVTQRALDGLIARFGMHYGSLTTPLHNAQVQRLLWERYRAVRDLQYSCWLLGPDQSACSDCPQCLRMAIGALAAGGNPADMGIELRRVLMRAGTWMPKSATGPQRRLPDDISRAELTLQMIENVRAVSPGRVLEHLNVADIDGTDGEARAAAHEAYCDLHERLAHFPERAIGYRPGYLAGVDPLLRRALTELYAASFPADPEDSYAEMLSASDKQARWILEPLALA